MKAKREYAHTEEIPENLVMLFRPLPEPSSEFVKRKEEVQEMMAQMILFGRKKGRPSQKEGLYEKAA